MKTIMDYERDITKEKYILGIMRADLINERKYLANSYLVQRGEEKKSSSEQLKEIDSKRKMVKNYLDYLRRAQSNLEKALIFDREDILNVILYLVSVMEEQEYAMATKDITFFDDNRKTVQGPLTYKFNYLTPVSSKEDAKAELKEKYPYELSGQSFDTEMLFKGLKYTGIALYKDDDSEDIIFSNHSENVISSEPQTSFGYINDERFSYIKDFIDMVINYRAYKECEFAYPLDMKLSYEELYNLANQFIEDRKSKKSER